MTKRKSQMSMIAIGELSSPMTSLVASSSQLLLAFSWQLTAKAADGRRVLDDKGVRKCLIM